MLHKNFNKTPGMSRNPSVIENLPIRIAGVIKESIVDGPKLRFVIFTQGCPHHCPGCHNPETHDCNGGFMTSLPHIWKEITANPLIKGVTFSGGEPFLWGHELAVIGKAASSKGLDIVTFSGYTYEQLLRMAETDCGVRELLTVTNILIDGPYIEAERNLSLKYRGSSNQRILDITCYPNSTDATVLTNL